MTVFARLGVACCLGTLLLGCDPNASEFEDDGSTPCLDAAEHLSDCAGRAVELGPDCDPEFASAVLESDCDRLAGPPGKADVFGEALCASGLLYFCDDPVCELPPDLPSIESFIGQCDALIELEGCGSCQFYRCKELERGEEACGDSGYYEGFVGPYCERFTELTRPTLSPAGQQWIDDVRACLQESMVEVGSNVSCPEVKRRGYAAHPGCYVETGFCELPFADIWNIFRTVDPRDLGLEPFTTGFRCVFG